MIRGNSASSLSPDLVLRMLDATGKVANRVKDFPFRLAQIFLRCVTLGDIQALLAFAWRMASQPAQRQALVRFRGDRLSTCPEPLPASAKLYGAPADSDRIPLNKDHDRLLHVLSFDPVKAQGGIA
jgi:hypothetical protein